MVYLLFTVRLRGSRGLRIWRRARADVYAWLAVRNTDDAKARARAEMERRGYDIGRVHVARDRDSLGTVRLPWSVRANMWIANRYGAVYQFHPHSTLWDPEDEADAAGVSAGPQLGLTFDGDLTRVPEELRALVHFGRRWAIPDDVERARFLRRIPLDEKRAFLDAVIPKLGAIEAFSRAHAGSVPMPDAVVLLDALAQNSRRCRAGSLGRLKDLSFFERQFLMSLPRALSVGQSQRL